MGLMRHERREYQRRAVNELPERLRRHGRVVAVSPTGSGKTVVAVLLILRLQRQHPRLRVLWLVHRIELIRQAYEQLRAAGIREADLGILSGAMKLNTSARILVASVDMFRTRDVPKCDLMVIDEAHRVLAATYKQIVEYSEKRWLLGLTATPWRLDGNGLGDVFSDMLVMAGHTELIAYGYIARPVTYGISRAKARALVAGMRIDRGDYAQADLAKAMTKRPLMGDVVSECARLAPNAPTLVFAVNRKHGQKLAARFKQAGRAVEYLDGKTPDAVRTAMIGPNGRLASGETQVVVNIDVLSEGYDLPSVKCISVARPTRSLTRFLQYVGRGARPYEKQRPIVLDHAGNCHRFGLPEWDREWSLEDRPKRPPPPPNPVKECVACEALIAANARVCPECGAEQPLSEREIEEQRVELERLDRTRAQRAHLLREIERLAKEIGADRAWIERAKTELDIVA